MFNKIFTSILLILFCFLLYLLIEPWINAYIYRWNQHEDMGLLETIDRTLPEQGASNKTGLDSGLQKQSDEIPQEREQFKDC